MKKKIKPGAKRIFSLLVCIAVLFSLGAMPKSSAETLESLQDKVQSYAQKIADSEKKVAELRDSKGDQEAIVNELNSQIDDMEEQVSTINSKIDIINSDLGAVQNKMAEIQAEIDNLTAKIAETEAQIEIKKAETEKTRQAVIERLCENYKAGNPSKLELLLDAKDISDYFNRKKLLENIAQADSERITKLKDETKALNDLKATYEADKANRDAQKSAYGEQEKVLIKKQAEKVQEKSSLETVQNKITDKYETANQEIAKLDKSSAAFQAQIKRYNAEMDKAEAAIVAYIAANGSKAGDATPVSNDGKMMWPVKSSAGCKISSPFGMRTDPFTGQPKFHGGIDICSADWNSYGKPIVAAQGGTVILAGVNGGYGNCIIIDHGGALFTLYAHCSSFAVGKGSSVNKGQTIAYIGSTGASTGPHLHFEVRVGGGGSNNRVNPTGYVGTP